MFFCVHSLDLVYYRREDYRKHTMRAFTVSSANCPLPIRIDVYNTLFQAHNIVTPHSWPSRTSFSGDPIRNSNVRLLLVATLKLWIISDDHAHSSDMYMIGAT